MIVAAGRNSVTLTDVPAGVLVRVYRWRGRTNEHVATHLLDVPFHVALDRVSAVLAEAHRAES